MTDQVRYVFTDRVVKVEEKQFTVGGRRTADGKAELFMESAGWHVTFGTMMSFYVGDIEPALQAGDKVRISIEKIK
jgi:hypothetical protein